jgi:uncharacterized membrane protein (UPF0136 family)
MKKMTPSRYMMLYGTVVLIAGFIGAITANSLISLIFAGIFGSLAALSGWGMQNNKTWARSLGFAVSGILAIFFMIRMIQGSPFPALAVAGLSMIAIAMLIQDQAAKSQPETNDKEHENPTP